MNGIDVDDPDGGDLTEKKIKRLMNTYGLDRETVLDWMIDRLRELTATIDQGMG